MNKKRNILYICNLGDVHNIKWVSYFIKLDHRIFVSCEQPDYDRITPELRKKYELLGISVLPPLPPISLTNPVSFFKASALINSWIKQYDICLIHALFGTHALYGLFCSKPFFITTRGSDILLFIPSFMKKNLTGKIWKYLYHKAFKKATIITSTSYKQRDKVLELFGDLKNTHVIRTGIDVENIEKLNQLDHIPKELIGERIIFAPRYLKPVYNNELLLKAIPHLPNKIRQDHLFLFIRDPFYNKDYVTGFIMELDRLQVKYIIKEELDQPQIWSCFKQSSLIIMTPLSDGTPNTALEAMASRCKMILGQYEYDKDIFSDVCIQLKENTPKELAVQIEKALDVYPEALLDNALDKVRKLGNRTVEMEKLKMLYHKVLNTTEY